MATQYKLCCLLVLCLTCVFTPARCQFPPFENCCSQSIRLSAEKQAVENRLQNTLVLLDSTRAVSARLLSAKDTRLAELTREANTRVERAETQAQGAQTAQAKDRTFITQELLKSPFLKWGLHRRIKRHLRANP